MLGLYDFGDGGSEAKAWKRRHEARVRKLQAKKVREQIKASRKKAQAEERADLKRRRAKWRQACIVANAEGRKRPYPPRVNKTQINDITGQRYGRLTVVRMAPCSKNRGRNRRCYVVCDCGSGEHLVAATCLRQKKFRTRSCGCLRTEVLRSRKGERRAKPLSVKLLDAAGKLRQSGNVRIARLLELSAPAVRVSERRKARRKKRGAQCRKR